MRLVLASASPRRAEVLRDAGISFETLATTVDESPMENELPRELVLRLAQAKARAAAERLPAPAIVVGADTEVVVEGRALGKPTSEESARQMLRQLSGRTHEVLGGLAVVRLPDGAARLEHEITRVTFAPLDPAEIADYIASGEPFGKAGGYAIQGRGGRFVIRVEGCCFNIVGLPLARLYRILRELGWRNA